MKVKTALVAFALSAYSVSVAGIASADGYKTCPKKQTAVGLKTVRATCGALNKPNFRVDGRATLADIATLQRERDEFRVDVKEFGQCVTRFINSYRRPGADANSTAPDEAACAHAWAEEQLTESIREFGRSCYAFNDRANIKGAPSFNGSCYPSFGGAGGQ
jgi:hypothetical protein